MTRIKKIAASILAAASISAMGITSFAATATTSYEDVDYSFSLSPWKSVFTSVGAKEDSSANNYAKVYTKDGNLSTNVYAQFDIFDYSDADLISDTVKATSNDSSYRLNYTEARGEGSLNVLRATAGRYSVYSTGIWHP